jgi:hypothetical protein
MNKASLNRSNLSRLSRHTHLLKGHPTMLIGVDNERWRLLAATHRTTARVDPAHKG